MDVAAKKIELIKLLLQIQDPITLNKLNDWLVVAQKEVSINSALLEEPYDSYNQKLERSEDDLMKGNVISHQDLKKKYNF
ncbi:hypothetical protein OX284_010000 [Flavobacterium sp. SUN046]|uniref:hypothetical protein n=1 Tax=Flavobacterium sp. SUN046 TaxID=3002440 RepID=UPI002DB9EBD8|nr:hypothetical protein [Flavobacterium sp. SUN046]MEC4049759.1 hypothetical protein [Flavobacterium sp. SUN046]